MRLSEKQRGVLKGMVSALVVAVMVLAAGSQFLLVENFGETQGSIRLQVAAVALVPVALALMISIGTLARHRFFTPEDIDGSGLTQGTAQAHTLQAVLQNTLEQSVLAFLTYCCFAALAPLSLLGAVPAGALLFVAGRVFFWIGYSKGAPARAFGFALTFYSTNLLLIACAIFAVTAI
ncbi:MAPEG family protein [Labrenzia sp. PHM005]|uniref:MAPEG family protein n=1 Tax=Labrenzia sp. PHM005 TaxID=2590016 RepID=UPI0011404708|nr:MAPEG family protein [Labrenzia sp. PHM005]QDG75339.1 MAPEG family protein [Labrenzia sp. PHM005]